MSLDDLRRELGHVDLEILRPGRSAGNSCLSRSAVPSAMPVGRARLPPGKRSWTERARGRRDLGVRPEIAEELVLLLIARRSRCRSATASPRATRHRQARAGDRRRRQDGRWFVRFLGSQGYESRSRIPAARSRRRAATADWRDACAGSRYHRRRGAARDRERHLARAGHASAARAWYSTSARSRARCARGCARSPTPGLKSPHCIRCSARTPSLLSGRHVVLVDVGAPRRPRRPRRCSRRRWRSRADGLESHDRVIAYVLGLSHALNLVFFTALADSGESAPSWPRCRAPPSKPARWRSQVAGENPHLTTRSSRSTTTVPSRSRRCSTPSSACVRWSAPTTPGSCRLMERGRALLEHAQTVSATCALPPARDVARHLVASRRRRRAGGARSTKLAAVSFIWFLPCREPTGRPVLARHPTNGRRDGAGSDRERCISRPDMYNDSESRASARGTAGREPFG